MKTKKWLLAIMVCVSLCMWFTGCDNAVSSDSSEDAVTFSYTDSGSIMSYNFLKDGTFTCTSKNGNKTITSFKGTYTGNPAIDGEITEVLTHNWSRVSNSLVTIQEYCDEIGIPYNPSIWTSVTTISGGSFTVGIAPDLITFTRD